MRSISRSLAALVGVAAMSATTTLHAQAITAGQWNAMVAPTNNTTPFWDGRSSDGVNCNIGFFLLYPAGGGFGPCANSHPSAAFVNANAGRLGSTGTVPNGSFLSASGGVDVPPDFTFAAGSYRLEFLGNVAGFGPPSQELWAFGAGVNGPVALKQLYGGANAGTLPTVFNVNFTTDWFLGARTAAAGNAFLYSTGSGIAHFALFSSDMVGTSTPNAPYWAAFGDTPRNGDSDYNDLVLQLNTVSTVPEPSTWALMAFGLGSIVVARRRSQRAAVARA